MKVPLVFLTLAFVSAAPAQDLSKRVDYVSRAKTLSIVLDELSKQTGVQLTCASDIESEPLILRLNNVPLQAAMDKISYVFAGEWVKKDRSFELKRGKKAERLHVAVVKTYAADFATGVQNLAKARGLDVTYSAAIANSQINDLFRAAAGPTFNPEIGNHVKDRSPLTRLLIRVLMKMDPNEVANLPSSVPTVFSNQPTTLQSPLSLDLRNEVDKYEEEQSVLDGALVAVSGHPKEKSDWARQFFANRSREPISRLLLTITGARGRYYAGLLIADASGRVIDEGSVDINWNSDARDNAVQQSQIYRSTKVSAPLGPVSLDILPNINNVYNFRRVKPETKATLLVPTQIEPLSIATCDAVLGLAEKDQANVAFLPPDDADSWIYSVGRSGKVSLAALEQQAAYSKEQDVSEQDGWLVGAPVDPLEISRQRLSRPALEEYLNALESEGKYGIDSRARFEAEAGPDSNKILASDAMMSLFNWDFYNEETGNEACLALLGSLDERQRSLAANGGLRLLASNLTDQESAYLNEWLLSYGASFKPEKYTDASDATVDGRGYPTEVLAGGSSGAFLEVTDQKSLQFDFKRTADGQTTSYGCGLEHLARLSAEAERPDLFPDSVGYHLDAIRIGSTREVTLRFVVGERSEVAQFHEYSTAPKSDAGVPIGQILDKLPEDQKQVYTQALEKYRQEFLKKRIG